MNAPSLVVVGDVLFDTDVEGDVERLCPDAPAPVLDERARRSRPGGAGLAAALAAAGGARVTLVGALASDEPARELRELLAAHGVAEIVELDLDGTTPEKNRLLARGRLLCRHDRGGGRPRASARALGELERALAGAGAVLVSDYGRGVGALGGVRAALTAAASAVPLVWDPHPRGAEPVPGARLATPNRAEALSASGLGDVERAAEALRRRWRAAGVAVTLGADGALLCDGGPATTAIPAAPAGGGDACGAGDRFASAAAAALARGAGVLEAAAEAVAEASRFVAAGGAAALPANARPSGQPPGSPAREVVSAVRARGGLVVATGGCFDLLHVGHVRLLQAARSLGECLVVCLNSDESVRRLKGFDRPVVCEEDRAAVLEGLACVDAVEIFAEDTPERVLSELRPDVWVKGGDYRESELPEGGLVRSWGGRVAVLPYVEGRSTTRLLEELVAREA